MLRLCLFDSLLRPGRLDPWVSVEESTLKPSPAVQDHPGVIHLCHHAFEIALDNGGIRAEVGISLGAQNVPWKKTCPFSAAMLRQSHGPTLGQTALGHKVLQEIGSILTGIAGAVVVKLFDMNITSAICMFCTTHSNDEHRRARTASELFVAIARRRALSSSQHHCVASEGHGLGGFPARKRSNRICSNRKVRCARGCGPTDFKISAIFRVRRKPVLYRMLMRTHGPLMLDSNCVPLP